MMAGAGRPEGRLLRERMAHRDLSVFHSKVSQGSVAEGISDPDHFFQRVVGSSGDRQELAPDSADEPRRPEIRKW